MRLYVLFLLTTLFITTNSEAFMGGCASKIIPIRCLRQSGNTCGIHSLYNASCFVKDTPRFMRNQKSFDRFFQEAMVCLEDNYTLYTEITHENFYLNQDNLNFFIQNCNFCDVLRKKDNFLIISHLDAVEHVLSNKKEYQDFLKTGGCADLMQNIKDFQLGKSPYQVIIINDSIMRHWFVVVIYRHVSLKKDFLLYADSLGIDRRNCDIIVRIYNLFTRVQ
jgi:hypothetical protein